MNCSAKTWSHGHGFNVQGRGKGGRGGGKEREQASPYSLRIRVHNDLKRTHRRLQIHTRRAVVLKSDITKQTT